MEPRIGHVIKEGFRTASRSWAGIGLFVAGWGLLLLLVGVGLAVTHPPAELLQGPAATSREPAVDVLVGAEQEVVEAELDERLAVLPAHFVREDRREGHEERVHPELELEPPGDGAAVLPAAPGHHAVPGAVRGPEGLDEPEELLPPRRPIDRPFLLGIAARVAHPLPIEHDPGPRVRHEAERAVRHLIDLHGASRQHGFRLSHRCPRRPGSAWRS